MEKNTKLLKLKVDRISEYPVGSPQEFGETMYWKFSEFDDLSVAEVKKCCKITISYLLNDSDAAMRLYYDMAGKHIESRGMLS